MNVNLNDKMGTFHGMIFNNDGWMAQGISNHCKYMSLSGQPSNRKVLALQFDESTWTDGCSGVSILYLYCDSLH